LLSLRFRQSKASWGRPMSRFTRVARSRVSGQQMFFARKRSANAASAKGFHSVRKRSDSNSTDVGHEGVITGRDGFSLRSYIANPQ